MHRLWVQIAIGVVVLFGVIGNPATAASWSDSLFSEKGHDFGPVPRGGSGSGRRCAAWGTRSAGCCAPSRTATSGSRSERVRPRRRCRR